MFVHTIIFVLADLVQSTTIFRQAAGIYHHLAQEVLPPLQPKLPPEKPPEALPSVSTIMSLICLAEAQVGVMYFSVLFHFCLRFCILSYHES